MNTKSKNLMQRSYSPFDLLSNAITPLIIEAVVAENKDQKFAIGNALAGGAAISSLKDGNRVFLEPDRVSPVVNLAVGLIALNDNQDTSGMATTVKTVGDFFILNVYALSLIHMVRFCLRFRRCGARTASSIKLFCRKNGVALAKSQPISHHVNQALVS